MQKGKFWPGRAMTVALFSCMLASCPPFFAADAAESYSFVRMWRRVPAVWRFDSPCDVAVDSSGNVFVLECCGHCVTKLDPSGNLLVKWGTEGSGDGQFYFPQAIDLDSSGNVYVADPLNHRIEKFDPWGEFLGQWGSEGPGPGFFRDPEGIAVDSSGNVYVADAGGILPDDDGRIHKFDSSGKVVPDWPTRGPAEASYQNPCGVAADAAGNVYVADSENGRVVKLDSSGNFLGKWQISGSTEGERGYPTDIAVNSAGNVFVVEHLGHAIHAFDSDSNFVRKWVIEFVPPSFPLGYAFYGMDMDTQDNIVLADPRNDRVEKFDPSGNSLARWGLYGSAEGEFRSLSAIAIDAFGNVFVADGRNYRVQKFDSFGKFLLKWGSKGSGDGQFGGNYAGPSDVMIDSSGNVIVADYANGRIQKFDSLGNFLQKWETRDPDEGKLLYPSAIALDSLGNVFILAAECVHKFDSSGDFVCKWGSHGSGNGQFDSPSGIEVDPSGNVYVVDARNYRIQKFDSAGNLLCKWGSFGTGDGQFWEASGIALDPFGNAFVSEANNHRIQKFDSSGRFLTKWGHEGFGEGEFFRPSDAAVDSSGNVLVADAGNYRIQMFRRDFGMRGIVGPPELPVIEWDCAPNKGYRVWASVDLSEWTALGSAIFGSNTGINSWTDDGQHPLGPASEALRRFYRVELQQ